MADIEAFAQPQPTGLPLAATPPDLTCGQIPGIACRDCGAPDAPHPGELATTRVGEGIVRDARVRRCTPCQQIHRAAGGAR